MDPVQGWLGEMAQLGYTGGHEEDCSGLELRQAVQSTQQFTALKPVSKWGRAASPSSLREGGMRS